MRWDTQKLSGRRVTAGAVVALALLIMAGGPARADDTKKAQSIVDQAQQTFSSFMSDEQYVWLQQQFPKATAVMIFPNVVKAAFIAGGSGGHGVLLVKNPKTGVWSEPAFYTLGQGSIGLQIGGEVTQIMLVAMSQRGVDALVNSSVKLGTDISVVASPKDAATKITADVVSVGKKKGVFAGISVDGAVLKASDGLNQSYYGRKVGPSGIVRRNEVQNKRAAPLRSTLKRAGRG